MGREALLGIAVGKKGVGKTYATLLEMNKYQHKHPHRKVLVLDVNNEFVDVRADQNPQFKHIKGLDLTMLPAWVAHPTVDMRRISIIKPNGEGRMNLAEIADALHQILTHFRNGLLLIEDINKFISDSLPNDLIGAIATQRHASVDIITHFQTVGKMANPKLWGNANYIRFHKCEDTVERHKNKFGGSIVHLYILERLVNMQYKKGDQRFYAFYDKDDGKIKGAFTKEQFKEAIIGYLEDNYSGIVEKEAKRKTLQGAMKHPSHEAAAQYLIDTYIEEYYGNPK